MELRVYCDTAQPHGTQQTTETAWNLLDPRLYFGKVTPLKITGVPGILPALVESSVHCDTVQPHGNMGTIVMQWNLMGASVICEHSMVSWNPGASGTVPWLVEVRGNCDIAGPLGTQKNIVGQWNLMEPSVNCKNSGASWNPSDRCDSMESHETVSCNTLVCHGTQCANGTLPLLIEPSVHCDTTELN